MIPGASYSASNSESTSQAARNDTTAKSGASGGSRGVVNNIAFPGANLEADTGGDGGGAVPVWVWGLGAVAIAGGAWFLARGRR